MSTMMTSERREREAVGEEERGAVERMGEQCGRWNGSRIHEMGKNCEKGKEARTKGR